MNTYKEDIKYVLDYNTVEYTINILKYSNERNIEYFIVVDVDGRMFTSVFEVFKEGKTTKFNLPLKLYKHLLND